MTEKPLLSMYYIDIKKTFYQCIISSMYKFNTHIVGCVDNTWGFLFKQVFKNFELQSFMVDL